MANNFIIHFKNLRNHFIHKLRTNDVLRFVKCHLVNWYNKYKKRYKTECDLIASKKKTPHYSLWKKLLWVRKYLQDLSWLLNQQMDCEACSWNNSWFSKVVSGILVGLDRGDMVKEHLKYPTKFVCSCESREITKV